MEVSVIKYICMKQMKLCLQSTIEYLSDLSKIALKVVWNVGDSTARAILLTDGLYAKIPLFSLVQYKRNVEAKFPFI